MMCPVSFRENSGKEPEIVVLESITMKLFGIKPKLIPVQNTATNTI